MQSKSHPKTLDTRIAVLYTMTMKRRQLNMRTDPETHAKLARIRKLWPGDATPSVSAVIRTLIDRELKRLEARR